MRSLLRTSNIFQVLLFGALLCLLVACSGNEPQDNNNNNNNNKKPEVQKCNGFEHLCKLRLNEIVFIKTHNSHAAKELGYHFLSSNHEHAVPKQLEAGVRSFNYDVYLEKGKMVLCHGYCNLGQQEFSAGLKYFVDFLKKNPNDVLLLDFQDVAPVDKIVESIKTSGLDQFAHSQKPSEAWPVLNDMIKANKRIVFFSRKTTSSTPSWYHKKSDFIFSTDWKAKEETELSCKTGKKIKNGLFELNHFLTNPIASPGSAKKVNIDPFLTDRINKCTKEVGQMPNIVAIDYYTTGDAINIINKFNAAKKK